jgi:hypothetical protein
MNEFKKAKFARLTSSDQLNQGRVRCGTCKAYLKITPDLRYDYYWHSCRCTATPVKLWWRFVLRKRSEMPWLNTIATWKRYAKSGVKSDD